MLKRKAIVPIVVVSLLIVAVLVIVIIGFGGTTPSQPSTQRQDSPAVVSTQQSRIPEAVDLQAVEPARKAFVRQFGAILSDIEILDVQPVEWPNGCLGAELSDEDCAPGSVPGYYGFLLYKDEKFEYHMNQDGTRVRFVPGAVFSAKDYLNFEYGLEVDTVKLVSFERTDWPDTCLGVYSEDLTGCEQKVIPGYKITLAAADRWYVFHTNLSGSDAYMSEEGVAWSLVASVTWTRESEESCQSLIYVPPTIMYGPCDRALKKDKLPAGQHADEFVYLTDKYASFEAETPAGRIMFSGRGPVVATDVEQRMIAEWTRLIYEEIITGQSSAAGGVALTYHREGGVVGFCEDMLVYINGIAVASSCQSNQAQPLGTVHLNSLQLNTLYQALDQVRSFDLHKDSAAADAVNYRLTFSGIGPDQATETEQQAIHTLASDLLAQLTTQLNADDLQKARQALVDYFALLKQGAYAQAVPYYGGDYTALADKNPSLDISDKAALFDTGCNINGYICILEVSTFVDEAQLSTSKFRFIVQFVKPDGSMYSASSSQTQFEYSVIKQADGWFTVQELPPYAP